ncbi:hypothetical protein [Catenulispora rubra]|uniref:hypothetical protein n=1 Tax=Catenulispora rubra TaxID=280293 RepID=UPI001891FDEE|nr:hypothetical protein [Catenulispora rubra]
MTTYTQPWLRAELIAAPDTTPGAQLMIPADGVEFHDDQLVFHHQGDVVYVAAQGQLRSITWFAKQPNPETARRKAQWPKHGTRWTDEERTDLLRRVRAGESWKTISLAHGRSRTGCQQEAVKQGWIHPDTLRPTPELLLSIVEEDSAAVATSAPTERLAPNAGPTDATEPSLPNDTASLNTNAAPSSDTNADTAATAEVPAPDTRSTETTAPSAPRHRAAETTPASAAPSPEARPAAQSSAAPSISGRTTADTTADSAAPAISTTAKPPTDTGLANKPAFVAPIGANPAAPTAAPATSTAATPPTGANPAPPAAIAIPTTIDPGPAKVSAFVVPVAIAMPNPDRPQIQPRVPRQRTDSNPQPKPKPDGDSEKDSEPGSSPGSRFLSRAQSSLARATLGAYMNPPRGQSGTAT